MGDPVATDERLATHVRQFLPDAQADEMAHRIALLKARDWSAAMRGRNEGGLAFDLACYAHEVAGAFVFRPDEPDHRLELATVLCRRLVGAAMAAEALNTDETPL